MDSIAKQFTRTDGYPRPTTPRIELSELRLADILLSRGDTEISNAIVAGDGGSYSHAALWSGSAVIEAVLAGTSEHPFDGDRDVYRHEGLTKEVATEIVGFARMHVGKKYAYTELMMLGLLFALGIHPASSLLDSAVRLLGKKAENLQRYLDSLPAGRSPRVCTELVALSYFQAAGGKFALRIVPRSQRPGVYVDIDLAGSARPAVVRRTEPNEAAHSALSLTELHDSCQSLLARQLLPLTSKATEPSGEAPLEAKKLLAGAIAIDAQTGGRLGVITPGDFQFSPTLRFVGRVSSAPKAQ